MVRTYVFSTPIETEAVMDKPESLEGQLPYFEKNDDTLLYEMKPDGIVREFRQMIGQSFLPPKWAFGFGQSRWSCRTSQEVAEGCRGNHNRSTVFISILIIWSAIRTLRLIVRTSLILSSL